MNWQVERDLNVKLKEQNALQWQRTPPFSFSKPIPTKYATDAQAELWEESQYNFHYVERILEHLPRYKRELVRKIYLGKIQNAKNSHRTFTKGQKSPYFEANKWVRSLKNRIDLALSQYGFSVSFFQQISRNNHFDWADYCHFAKAHRTFQQSENWKDELGIFNKYQLSKMEKGAKPFYLLSEKAIEDIAFKIANVFAIHQRDYFDKLLKLKPEEGYGALKVSSFFVECYKQAGKEAERMGFTFKNWANFKKRGVIREDHACIQLAKIIDEKYWKRLMLRKQKQVQEHVAIACGEVRARFSAYVSKEAFSQWEFKRQKNFDFLKAMILENQDNPEEQLELFDVVMKTDTFGANKRHLMMSILRGCEDYADENEHESLFLTLTAPSAYHAELSKGGHNPKWNGSSPKQTQNYLNKVWQETRALLAKRNIRFYGMRCVEPHQDATPHWHLLVFVKKEQKEEFMRVCKLKALEEDSDEKGAKKYRFKAEIIDKSKGSAVSYIAKYIAKNIDGFASEKDKLSGASVSDEDETLSTKDNAKRVKAWASLWGIRQFQFFGTPSVGVWRALRKLTGVLKDSDLEEMRICADLGCWASYMQRQGGAMVKKVEQVARLHYETLEPNKYGESRKAVDGIQKTGFFDFIKTKLKKWTIKRKQKADLTGENALNIGESKTPWTCVSNCNHINGEVTALNAQEFLNANRNEAENLKNSLKLRQVSMKSITDFGLCKLIQGDTIRIYGGLKIFWDRYSQEVQII